MKFATAAFSLLLTSQFNASYAANEPQRRVQESECTLLLKAHTPVEGHERHAEVVCEMEDFGMGVKTSRILKVIDGPQHTQQWFLDRFESGELVSGHSKMISSKAYWNEMMTELSIDASADLDKDLYFGGNRSADLSIQATGTKKVIILRVITGGGSQVPPSSEARLSDKWFGTDGDTSNNKSQFAAISFGKVAFEPYIDTTSTGKVITNGVYTITVSADRLNDSQVESEARQVGAAELGSLTAQFDYVCLSVPNNDESYAAYAYINSWLSLYKHTYVDQVTVQMHEIGHNIGLAHSGEGGSTYGDVTGIMGASFYDDRRMTFNGAKNGAQLSWYNDRRVTAPFDGDLYGISDYATTGTSAKMNIKFTEGSKDYYVSFNKKSGINNDTREYGNQVLVHSRSPGSGYATSVLEAHLTAGGSYAVGSTSFTVGTIGNTAQINFGSAAPAPAPSPTTECVDYPNWVDSYNDGCEWYEENDSQGCPTYGNYFDGGQGTPNEACCWCGGGNTGTPAPVTPAPITSTPIASPSAAPVVSPTTSGCDDYNGKRKCNRTDGCSWKRRQEICAEALPTSECESYDEKKRKCKNKGCKFDTTTKECTGRWD